MQSHLWPPWGCQGWSYLSCLELPVAPGHLHVHEPHLVTLFNAQPQAAPTEGMIQCFWVGPGMFILFKGPNFPLIRYLEDHTLKYTGLAEKILSPRLPSNLKQCTPPPRASVPEDVQPPRTVAGL